MGTAFTGGAFGVVIGMAAGVAVGAMSSMPIGEDRSIGDAISDFCDSIGNAIDSPDVYGEIKSGSKIPLSMESPLLVLRRSVPPLVLKKRKKARNHQF